MKKDLTGQRFGKLVVLKRAPNRGQHVRWLCRCDCGNEREVFSTHLIRGNTKSCTCLWGQTPPNWKGHGEISGKFYNQIVRKIDRPSRMNLVIDITPEFLWELFLKQNKRCALSGQNLTLPTWKTKGTASLDRISSLCGYTKDNVQWIHKDINKMKNIFSQNYFIETCRSISDYCNYHYGDV